MESVDNDLKGDSISGKKMFEGQSSSTSNIHSGVIIGSASIFSSMLGIALTFPFLQAQRDSLGCDALCYGSMQSARSGLSLIGSALAGRLSDQLGRGPVLILGLSSSLLSYSISLNSNSVSMMWMAMIPSALLNQNFSVLKALFADYQSDLKASESERAAAMGRLSMSVGVSFMIGPVIAATFIRSYAQAMCGAIICTVVSGVLLFFLPVPRIELTRKASSLNSLSQQTLNNSDRPDDNTNISRKNNTKTSYFQNLKAFLSLPVLTTPGAKLLLFMRCAMGLAFNIFMTIWPSSLRSRFGFTASDHAYFMGYIGLCYALSQGVVAQLVIKYAGEDKGFASVLGLCMVALGFGRVGALYTGSLVVVYVIMAFVIFALGIVNTSISGACSRLAGVDQVGGLYGVMEAVENLAGLVGPTVGGILFRYNSQAPVVVVVSIYALLFAIVSLYYDKTIIRHSGSRVDKKE